jgi:PAS domain S-box-containing protein
LETIVDIIHNPIFYKDAKGIYQFCNTAFCEFVGRPKSEIIGSSVFDIAPNNLADTYHKKDQALFNSKGHQAYESQVMRSDGVLRDVIFLKSIYTDVAEQASGLIGVILDITPEPRLRAYKDYIAFLNETIMELDRNMNDYTHVTCMLEELTAKLIKHIKAAEQGCIFEFDSETHKLKKMSSLPDSSEKGSQNDHAERPKDLMINHETLSRYVKKEVRYSLPFDLKTYENDISPVGNLIDLHHNDHSKLLLPLVYNGKLAHVIVLEAGENKAFTDMDGIMADYVTQKIPLLYQIYTLTRKMKAFKNR